MCHRLARSIALCLWCALAVPAQQRDAKPGLIIFEAPGAGTQSGQGTIPIAVNQAGAIVGTFTYLGDGVVGTPQGFVRAADGTISEFFAPGGGDNINTTPQGINSAGTIAGHYSEYRFLSPGNPVPEFFGFVRTADGTLTSFTAPGAAIGWNEGTLFNSINDSGAITGRYEGSTTHGGFVRDPDGTYASFSVGAFTAPLGIANSGAVVGYYLDESGVSHGFLRTPSGSLTTFDTPGAGTDQGTGTLAVSTNGKTTAGYYIDSGVEYHGFVRSANGIIITFDAPGAGADIGLGTIVTSIPAGAVSGYATNANGSVGFVRSATGTITTFSVQAACQPVLWGWIRREPSSAGTPITKGSITVTC
jgi:hypothetical protein